MARRELDAGHPKALGHQVHKRVVRFGQVQVHRVHHFLGRMRPGNGQHLGVHLAHQIIALTIGACAQAAGHDNAPVVGQGLTNRVQAFLDRVVDKAAGVDDDQVGARKGFGGLVALGAQLREDQFGVGQRLGAAQADKADGGCARGAGAVGGCNSHELKISA